MVTTDIQDVYHVFVITMVQRLKYVIKIQVNVYVKRISLAKHVNNVHLDFSTIQFVNHVLVIQLESFMMHVINVANVIVNQTLVDDNAINAHRDIIVIPNVYHVLVICTDH